MEIQPINETEKKIMESDDFIRVLDYGKVRSGHPEGSVGNHIRQMLEYIEANYKGDEHYEKLRILALLHDIGKSDDRERPHSEVSAEIASKFTDDPELIEMTRIHDLPYRFWRLTVKKGKPFDEIKFRKTFKRIDWKLLVKFRYCDNCARSQKPSEWFDEKCRELFEKKKRHPHAQSF